MMTRRLLSGCLQFCPLPLKGEAEQDAPFRKSAGSSYQYLHALSGAKIQGYWRLGFTSVAED